MSYRILVVCTGNICRSPMAEGLLKSMLPEAGWKDMAVRSAGAAAWPGHPASPEAVEAMQEMGIDIRQHEATLLDADLVNESDLILVMGSHHRQCVVGISPQADTRTHLISEFGAVPRDGIADPIGMGLDRYRECAAEIKDCAEGVVKVMANLIEGKGEES